MMMMTSDGDGAGDVITMVLVCLLSLLLLLFNGLRLKIDDEVGLFGNAIIFPLGRVRVCSRMHARTH